MTGRPPWPKCYATEEMSVSERPLSTLHVGRGYMRGIPDRPGYLDSRVQTIYGGTTEIMKEIIGRGLECLGATQLARAHSMRVARGMGCTSNVIRSSSCPGCMRYFVKESVDQFSGQQCGKDLTSQLPSRLSLT